MMRNLTTTPKVVKEEGEEARRCHAPKGNDVPVSGSAPKPRGMHTQEEEPFRKAKNNTKLGGMHKEE
jgi:hypothetical protein